MEEPLTTMPEVTASAADAGDVVPVGGAAGAELPGTELSIEFEGFPSRRRFTEAELVVIETYLADILDEILGGAGAPLASLRHTGSA